MTAVSKNVYIDKLDHIINEQNNSYHRTIKMKPIEDKDNTYINSIKEVTDKDPKCQNTKRFLLKDILQICPKNLWWLKKLKILLHRHTFLIISVVTKLLEHFMKKNYKNQIHNDLA